MNTWNNIVGMDRSPGMCSLPLLLYNVNQVYCHHYLLLLSSRYFLIFTLVKLVFDITGSEPSISECSKVSTFPLWQILPTCSQKAKLQEDSTHQIHSDRKDVYCFQPLDLKSAIKTPSTRHYN